MCNFFHATRLPEVLHLSPANACPNCFYCVVLLSEWAILICTAHFVVTQFSIYILGDVSHIMLEYYMNVGAYDKYLKEYKEAQCESDEGKN